MYLEIFYSKFTVNILFKCWLKTSNAASHNQQSHLLDAARFIQAHTEEALTENFFCLKIFVIVGFDTTLNKFRCNINKYYN